MAAVRRDLRPAQAYLLAALSSSSSSRVGGFDLFYTHRRVLQLDADILDSDSSPARPENLRGPLPLERGLAAHRRYLAPLHPPLRRPPPRLNRFPTVFRSADRRARRARPRRPGRARPRTPSPPKRAPPPPPSRAPARGRTSPTSTARPISRVSAGDHASKTSSFGPRRGEVETILTFARCAARRNSHATRLPSPTAHTHVPTPPRTGADGVVCVRVGVGVAVSVIQAPYARRFGRRCASGWPSRTARPSAPGVRRTNYSAALIASSASRATSSGSSR